jgi:hypothetical protein
VKPSPGINLPAAADARLKKIGLDMGIAVRDEIYLLLPGIDPQKPT